MTYEMKFDLLHQKMVEEQYRLKARLMNTCSKDELFLYMYSYTERWYIVNTMKDSIGTVSEETVDRLLAMERPLQAIYEKYSTRLDWKQWKLVSNSIDDVISDDIARERRERRPVK